MKPGDLIKNRDTTVLLPSPIFEGRIISVVQPGTFGTVITYERGDSGNYAEVLMGGTVGWMNVYFLEVVR